MLIEKYVNVVLNEREMNTIKEIAEEQDMAINMVLRLVFSRGLDETIKERNNEENKIYEIQSE